MIKKSLCMLLIGGMMFAFSACGKTVNQPQAEPAAAQSETAADSTAQGNTAVATSDSAVSDKAGAKLEQLNLKEGDSPIIRGVSLDGNRAGSVVGESKNEVNGRPLSNDYIRFVFELNEWISIKLDTDVKSGISATIAPHQADASALTESFIENLSDDSPRVDMECPENPEEPMSYWGETYLTSDSWQPGDYDLIFLSGKKPVARVALKLYREEELLGKSDAELNKLMLGK